MNGGEQVGARRILKVEWARLGGGFGGGWGGGI